MPRPRVTPEQKKLVQVKYLLKIHLGLDLEDTPPRERWVEWLADEAPEELVRWYAAKHDLRWIRPL